MLLVKRKKIIQFLISILLLSISGTGIIEAKEKHSDREYQDCGIIIKKKGYYYQEKRIRIFQDIREDKSFVKSFIDKKGTVDIRILRDDKDNIKKVKRISKKKANRILRDLR